MRTHMIQQYKKIKNSPMRSPSPDYACRNHSGRTGIPLEQAPTTSNAFIKNSIAQFPIVPHQIIKKRTISEIQNVRPVERSGGDKKICNSTAIHNSDQQKIWPLPEVSDFGTQSAPQSRISVPEMLKKIEQIYRIININVGKSEFYEPVSWAEKLETIKLQVIELISIKSNPNEICSPAPKHSQMWQAPYDSWNQSASKPQGEDSFCIFQINELTGENIKLTQQLTLLRMELIENEQKFVTQGQNAMEELKRLRRSSVNLADDTEEDSYGSYSIYQFLKQKISYLENELENQITKFTKMSEQKNEEIKLLREKIGQTSELLKSEMQRSRRLLTQNKEETGHSQSKSELSQKRETMSKSPSRLKTEIDGSGMNPFGQRKRLPWQRQEILSIDDNDHHEESQYSEAQRMEWELGPNRELAMAVQNIRDHYEEVIIKNATKYHEIMENMQSQLIQLRNYIELHDIESDSQHQTCQLCPQARETIVKKQIQLSDFQREIGLLRTEVTEGKKQNAKLRDLLQRAVVQEAEAKSSRGKMRGRGLQRILKKTVKSSNCSKEVSEALSGSQQSQSVNSSKQGEFEHQVSDAQEKSQMKEIE